MDVKVARITWTSCITASWKAGHTHGKITRLHSRPLWKAFCHFTRWSRAWFPFRTSMRTTREDLDGEIQRQMCLSVPQCNRTAFPCLPFTQNMHQGHRIRAATGRAKIVHYHGLKVSRKREVAKSFCDLGARPEIIVCQAVATKCASVLSLWRILWFPSSCSLPNIGWSFIAPFGNVVASASCESCNTRRALVPNWPANHRENTSISLNF